MLSRWSHVLLVASVLAACGTPDPVQSVSGPGRYDLPARISDQLVITDVTETGDGLSGSVKVTYLKSGKKKSTSFAKRGDSDGYLTYRGREFPPNPDAEKALREGESWDGPIIDERSIETPEGAIIGVAGNTVLQGQIRIRTLGNTNAEQDEDADAE